MKVESTTTYVILYRKKGTDPKHGQVHVKTCISEEQAVEEAKKLAEGDHNRQYYVKVDTHKMIQLPINRCNGYYYCFEGE